MFFLLILALFYDILLFILPFFYNNLSFNQFLSCMSHLLTQNLFKLIFNYVLILLVFFVPIFINLINVKVLNFTIILYILILKVIINQFYLKVLL